MPNETLKSLLRPAYRMAINVLPSRWHVIFDYVRFHHHWPNLKNPQKYNEKIAWRKLYDRNPMMPQLVDKVRAKEIVGEKFGQEFIIPTLAVYDSAEALDFTKPPLSNPPYVIKTNHGSGYNFFIKEPPADPEAIRRKLAVQLKTDYGNLMEEWAYSRIPHKILVEPYIEALVTGITDYKFHVFDRRIFAVEVVSDRFKGYYIDFFDRDWKPMNLRVSRRPNFPGEIKKPAGMTEMIRLAEALGKDFSYARVDLYEIDKQVKFGEMTFYPAGGLDHFDPVEWDGIFGQQWKQDWSMPAGAK